MDHGEKLRLSVEVRATTIPEAVFSQEVLDRGIERVHFEWLPTSLEEIGVFEEWGFRPISVFERTRSSTGTYSYRDLVVLVELFGGSVRLYAAGDRAEFESMVEALRDRLPALSSQGEIAMTFHFYDRRHDTAKASSRSIVVPAWETIRPNYTASVRQALDDLTSTSAPTDDGRLLLWHGRPGTGKTHAIRALARSWSEWCTPHFICDPEVFFSSSSYLLSVLLNQRANMDKWRIFVIEDAGEMLAPDARSQVGQGLSRLLNVVDGIMGQGLRILVLMTTNEPLARIHPAVGRAGRCMSLIDFAPLTEAEARAWLAEHDHDAPAAGAPRTIADLYAHLNGRARATDPITLGFAPA